MKNHNIIHGAGLRDQRRNNTITFNIQSLSYIDTSAPALELVSPEYSSLI